MVVEGGLTYVNFILRTTFYIRIDADNFYIATKEGQNIDCRRDGEMLIYTMDMLVMSDFDF